MENHNTDTDVERFIKYYWLNMGNVNEIIPNLRNPLAPTKKDLEDPSLYIMRKMYTPEFFYFTCKHLFNRELAPFQAVILSELWNRPFPMLIGTRGLGKTFLLALYAMLRGLLDQGSKVVICGAGFRQSKQVFQYCKRMWDESEMLQDLFPGKEAGPRAGIDKVQVTIGESTIIGLPIGNGEKIRGERATHLIAEEFASISREVFEIVLAGFTSVSQSPIESMQEIGRHKALETLGVDTSNIEKVHKSNQTIICGTAYYHFNHFYEYHQNYKQIIESGGDRKKLEAIFHGEIPPDFNWRDFSIVRIPVEMIGAGYMDTKSIARSKVSMNSSNYALEYGAVFVNDSDGFFKRSLIEKCVAKENDPIQLPSGNVYFNAVIKGRKNGKYVIGVDPASEADRFSVVVLEVHSDHNRVVYVWSTTKSEFRERKNVGGFTEDNFYAFCARKIRNLMKVFPTEIIGIDSQGGGFSVEEALHDADKLEDGELMLWAVINEDKPKPTDDEPGLHILEMVQFANKDWLSRANHGMKKDFEDQVLLFPDYDASIITIAEDQDLRAGRQFDTLEECIMEIEDLKDELATIQHTQTSTEGREHWDTPSIKLPGDKKGRMRKDRYSALLIANMIARSMQRQGTEFDYEGHVGYINSANVNKEAPMFNGPSWYTQNAGWFGTRVKR